MRWKAVTGTELYGAPVQALFKLYEGPLVSRPIQLGLLPAGNYGISGSPLGHWASIGPADTCERATFEFEPEDTWNSVSSAVSLALLNRFQKTSPANNDRLQRVATTHSHPSDAIGRIVRFRNQSHRADRLCERPMFLFAAWYCRRPAPCSQPARCLFFNFFGRGKMKISRERSDFERGRNFLQPRLHVDLFSVFA